MVFGAVGKIQSVTSTLVSDLWAEQHAHTTQPSPISVGWADRPSCKKYVGGKLQSNAAVLGPRYSHAYPRANAAWAMAQPAHRSRSTSGSSAPRTETMASAGCLAHCVLDSAPNPVLSLHPC